MSPPDTRKLAQPKFFNVLNIAICFLLISFSAQSQNISWKGYTWTLKKASQAGPGPNNWTPTNCFVDAAGFLHLLISTNTNSPNGFDCAELYTTDNLGFGTYQWQIATTVDSFDPWIVLGLFPYGPPIFGSDGSNEIDIEYSRWGKARGTNGWWTVYPDSGKNIGQKAYKFSSSGTSTTSRFTWNNKEIKYWMMDGFQPIGTTTNVIDSWNYMPTNFSKNIPQHAMPLHMNLWLFQGHVPANGQPAEVIIHDFRKI